MVARGPFDVVAVLFVLLLLFGDEGGAPGEPVVTPGKVEVEGAIGGVEFHAGFAGKFAFLPKISPYKQVSVGDLAMRLLC